MKYIINLHGFASSGNNSKKRVLEKLYPERIILSPDLEIEPKKVVGQVSHIIEDIRFNDKACHIAGVGSSLGGFYGFYTASQYKIPFILVNPSYNPSELCKKYLGENTNFHTGKVFEWKMEYIEQLRKLERIVRNTNQNKENYRILIGNKDETVDPVISKEFFKDYCTYEFDTDHSFDENVLEEALQIDDIRMLL